MPPQQPFIIGGKLYSPDGSTLLSNRTLLFTNLSTGDTVTIQSNQAGEYLFDCNQFENGYGNNERVKIELQSTNDYSTSDFHYYVSIDGGKTWQYVVHNVQYTPTFNKTRFKIHTGLYPAGRNDLDISLST